ncbi:MAG: hypothetical protein AABW58_00845 [Nanoarchaeota archaeon]
MSLELILSKEGISRRDLFKIGLVAGNLVLPFNLGCNKCGGSSPTPTPTRKQNI